VGGLGWIAVALVIFATWKPINAIFGSFIFGALRILKFYVNKEFIPIPDAFYDMLPFVITALVLILASARKSRENSQPASCVVNFFREER
jgi:simple sugar transport system permease protein